MVTSASPNRRLLDRYDLRMPLGKGGMGTVWLADDTLLQRKVAIKEVEIPAGVPADEIETLRARVMREARAAGRLNHPNVTTIYDVVREDGRTWIVMEYVDAPTLTEIVERDGPLSVQRAAEVGLGVLAALVAAHREGIVHRDVKPSNVMVAASGNVKLADFGVAAVQGDPKLTMTGFVIGSPSFMSPEQAKEGETTPASDLWGLGATLYFAVEGHPAFDRGAAIPTLTAVTHEDPGPLQRAGELEPIILRLLAKDPSDRPEAGEAAALLREVDGNATQSAAAVVAPATAPAAAAPADAGGGTAVLDATPPPTPVAPADDFQDDDWTGGDDIEHGRDRRGPWPLVLAALALLLVAGLTLPRLLGGADPTAEGEEVAGGQAAQQDDEETAEQADPADPAPGDAGADDEAGEDQQEAEEAPPAAEDEPADDPAEAEADTTDAGGGDVTVPEGWDQYTLGATGSTIAHPPDWSVIERSANSSDITAPDGDRYLRFEYTDSPKDDPVADWEAQSQSFGARKSDYNEIRVEPVDFRGHEAALWEYTYSEGGADLHAYNLAIVAGGRGYALNFQTHESVWDESQPLWDQFTASFDPAE